jgi:predicted nucleic acid-binding Zn ribbon protein
MSTSDLSWRHRDARALWRKTYGPIPAGFHIHHVDGNVHNNRLDNLQCLPGAEHLREHMVRASPELKAVRSAAAKRNQPKTKAWHASAAGLAWHRDHGKAAWTTRQPVRKTCVVCAAPYLDITRRSDTRFCSNNCKSEWRRRSRVDDVDRVCVGCGVTFRANQYTKIRACSKTCAWVERRRTKSAC